MDDTTELERLRAREAERLAKNAAYMRGYRARSKVKAVGRSLIEQMREGFYMKPEVADQLRKDMRGGGTAFIKTTSKGAQRISPLDIQIGPVTPPPGSRLKKR